MTKRPQRLQAMPGEAAGKYRAIIRRQKSIQSMIDVCLQEAVPHHNRPLIETHNELIQLRATEIEEISRVIPDFLPLDRTGRFPQWVVISDKITNLIPEILERTQKIERAIRMTEWSYLMALFTTLDELSKDIAKALAGLPKIAKVNGDEDWQKDKFEGWEEEVDEILNGK